MNKETVSLEETLARYGRLVYTTKGPSMRPFLRSGEDIVIIEAKGPQRCKKYDAVLYKRRNGRYVLHRVAEVRPEDYAMCGDNEAHLEPGITEEQVLGVLTGLLRKGKEIDVNTWHHRCLVRLWCWIRPVRGVYYKAKGLLWSKWNSLKARKN